MFRFWQQVLFLLSLVLLVSAGFFLLIRQQEPVERIIIQTRENGQTALTMLRIDGKDQRQLVMPNATSNTNIFWHPDGRWYVIQIRKALYLGRIDSLNQRFLAEVKSLTSFTLPRFSPDGRWIVIDEGRMSGGQFGERLLSILPFNGRQPAQVLDIGEIPSRAVLFWTPDSNWIVYENPETDTIYRIHRTGGAPQQIVTGELGYWGIDEEGFTVSATDETGQSVYRVRYDTLAQQQLFHFDEPYAIVRVSPDGKAIIGEREGVFYLLRTAAPSPTALPLETNPSDFTSFSWREDGGLYFYKLTGGGRRFVYQLPPDGSLFSPIHDGETSDFLSFLSDPEWMLLYQRDRSPANGLAGRIVRQKIDGTEMYPITGFYRDVSLVNWFRVPDHDLNWVRLFGTGLGLFMSSFAVHQVRQRLYPSRHIGA